MPKIKCSYCGNYNYGWALKYRDCHCNYCGNYLNPKYITVEDGGE